MPTCPPLYVDAPAVVPYGYGLFSVAQFPVDADDHWQCGVQYEPQACVPATAWGDPCDAAQPDKAVPAGVPLVVGTPFTIYAGFSCHLPGRTAADIQARAQQALQLGEQRAVEEAYWTGSVGSTPVLADNVNAVILNTVAGAPGALCPIAAVGELEGYLAANYGGTGVIHAPRKTIPYLARDVLVSADRSRMSTMLGTQVAAGGGYPGSGPDGTDAPAGTTWLYATGTVVIRRSPVWINPDSVAQALNRTSNQVDLLAERSYIVSHECVLAAVLTSLAC